MVHLVEAKLEGWWWLRCVLCLVLARRWCFFGRFPSARPLSLKVFASASQAQAHPQQNKRRTKQQATNQAPACPIRDSVVGRSSRSRLLTHHSLDRRPWTWTVGCPMHSARTPPARCRCKCKQNATGWLLAARTTASDRVRSRPIASDCVRFGPIRSDSARLKNRLIYPSDRANFINPARCFR
jgi:hypothetical protein